MPYSSSQVSKKILHPTPPWSSGWCLRSESPWIRYVFRWFYHVNQQFYMVLDGFRWFYMVLYGFIMLHLTLSQQFTKANLYQLRQLRENSCQAIFFHLPKMDHDPKKLHHSRPSRPSLGPRNPRNFNLFK